MSSTILKQHQYRRVEEEKQIQLLEQESGEESGPAGTTEVDDSPSLDQEQGAFIAWQLEELEQRKREMESWLAEQHQQLASELERQQREASQRLTLLEQEIRETAWKEGHQQGYEAGVAEAEATFAQQIELAQSLIVEAETIYEQRLKALEPALIQLALAVAEKVLRHTLQAEDALLTYIQEQLVRLKEEDEIHLLVHPEQYKMVQAQEAELRQMVSSKAKLVILPDHRVTVGGVIVETSYGSYDARIDSQLQQIHVAFQQYLRSKERGE